VSSEAQRWPVGRGIKSVSIDLDGTLLDTLDDLAAVVAIARENEFSGPEIIEMPANNLSVIFRRI